MSELLICPHCLGEFSAGARICPHCQRSFANRNPLGTLPFGTFLAGRYTVGEVLRMDGEGILYRGVENTGRFRVTIKEYMPVTLAAERTTQPELSPKPGSEVLFKTTRMDFAELYCSIQQVTPATGLEAVLDVFEENNTVYAVLENPGGKPLRQWLLEYGKPLRVEEALAMLQPVCNGVAAMHQVGLVHRGIGVENIRVLENGRARLTGYATIGLRTSGSGLHEQLYEGYSAPEQYASEEFEGRYTDEYALAAVFYRMLCGEAPVPAAQRLVADSNPPASTLMPHLPPYLSKVLDLGLRLKPAERIQTVPQLVKALSSKEGAEALFEQMRQQGLPHQNGPQPQKPPHGFGAKNLLAIIVILLSILVLMMLWIILGRTEKKPPAAALPESTAQSEPVVEEPPVERNIVPNLVGQSYQQVQNSREYAGTYLFYVTEDYSDTYKAGTIIEQQPAAGTEVEGEGQTIRLVISKGPERVEMPDIIGFTQDGAIAELENRGLVPSCFMVVNDGSYASGCVVKCSAEPGEKLSVGTTVTVYIAADRDVQPPDSTADAPDITIITPGAEGLISRLLG